MNDTTKPAPARRPLKLSRETVLAIRSDVRAGISRTVGGSSATNAWCPSCCSTAVSSC